MGGVDKCDQLVLYYIYAHRSYKWWKKVFFNLLDVSIVNANILYNMVAGKPLPQLDLRLSLVAELLDGHQRPVNRRDIAPTMVLLMRLIKHRFPKPVPKDTHYVECLHCKICKAKGKKRSQRQQQCNICKTPLHVHPCFKDYHTKLHYKY